MTSTSPRTGCSPASLLQVNANKSLLAKINFPREALIARCIPLITHFLMFLSPMVFPLASTGWTGTLIRLNPLTPLILNARDWFIGQPPQLLGEWVLTVGGSVLLLLLVWMVYRLAMPILIERMSA